jgi:matrix metalloproteinase-14 (membrane-inserted)
MPQFSDVDNGDLCDDGGKIDTIFSTADGSYYVFKGSQYWKLTDDSVDSGYPRRIRDDWPGLPNNIDAAVTWTENEMTYFFKGDEYWKFDNKEPSDGENEVYGLENIRLETKH